MSLRLAIKRSLEFEGKKKKQKESFYDNYNDNDDEENYDKINSPPSARSSKKAKGARKRADSKDSMDHSESEGTATITKKRGSGGKKKRAIESDSEDDFKLGTESEDESFAADSVSEMEVDSEEEEETPKKKGGKKSAAKPAAKKTTEKKTAASKSRDEDMDFNDSDDEPPPPKKQQGTAKKTTAKKARDDSDDDSDVELGQNQPIKSGCKKCIKEQETGERVKSEKHDKNCPRSKSTTKKAKGIYRGTILPEIKGGGKLGVTKEEAEAIIARLNIWANGMA